MKTRSRVVYLTCIAEDITTNILSKTIAHAGRAIQGLLPEPPPRLHEVCTRFRDIYRKDMIWKLICTRLRIVRDHSKHISYKAAYSSYLRWSFENNHISSAENEVGKAFHTDKLRIHYAGRLGQYERLLEHVVQITSLTSLDMADCEDIYSLPESISRLQNLKELNLNGCKHLHNLPSSVGNMKSLEVLRMCSRHSATSLPAQLGKLKRLRVLQMSCWTSLTVLPSCVCKLSALTVLTLNFCYRLRTLPKGMKRMKSLTSLAMINVTGIRKSKEQVEIIKGIDSLVRINYRAAAKFYMAIELINN